MLETQYIFLSNTIIVFLARIKVFNNISNVDLCYHYFNCIGIVLMVKLFGVLNWNVSNQGIFLSSCSAAVTPLKLEFAIVVLVGPWKKLEYGPSSVGIQLLGISRYQLTLITV